MDHQLKCGQPREAARAAQNSRHYQASKQKQDHLLMRLNKGERGVIDSAAECLGLSKTAFFQLYLIPVIAALTPDRIDSLHKMMRSKKLSLSSAIGRLIDSQADQTEEPATAASSTCGLNAALSFDALFNIPSSPDPDDEPKTD